MIPLFDAAASPARNPLSYNGLTYNTLIGSSEKDIIEVNFSSATSVIATTQESRETTDGLEVYAAYKRAKRIVQGGLVRASSKGALFDRLEELAAAFDPALVSRNNSTTAGFLPLDFNVPTADTATYPAGVIPCRYYLRAEEAVEPPQRLKQGLTVPFRIVLLAKDPRRYLQAESTVAVNSASVVASNPKADYPSWPTLTLTMAGAGAVSFQIDKSGDSIDPLTMDLSGLVSGDSVVVDMEHRTIKVNDLDRRDIYVSGGWFDLDPGNNTVTTNDLTNVTASLAWRPAFSH